MTISMKQYDNQLYDLLVIRSFLKILSSVYVDIRVENIILTDIWAGYYYMNVLSLVFVF